MTRSAEFLAVLVPLSLIAGEGCEHRGPPSRDLQATDREPQGEATLTFARDIAPIVFEKCAVCHRPGQSAPFSLLSYDDVRKRARQIVEVTGSRYMPPWLPEPGVNQFLNDLSLSAAQIERLARWVDEGAPEGDPRDLPRAPEFASGWQLGEPDLVLTMPEPYTLGPEGKDVYRNFVVPVPLSATRYVRAWEFHPGNPRIVHHAGFRTDRSGTARRLDAKDPLPGFEGMTLEDAAAIEGLEGEFDAWNPGKIPFAGYDDISWALDGDTDFVLELHLVRNGKPEVVQSRIALYFARQPPARHPAKLELGSTDLDIPARKRDYVVRDSYVLPVDVQVLGVSPHAHYLAREMQSYAARPDSSRQWLLHIKEWNFDWQGAYRYAEPIFLPRGTKIEMQFTYDNSAENPRNANDPPRRVVYGPSTTDEMCQLWLLLLPGRDEDQPLLRRSAAHKFQLAALATGERQVAAEPDPQLHVTLGILYRRMGRSDEAVRHARQALEIDAAFVDAHDLLGNLLAAERKFGEAAGHYREAIRLAPGRARAHYNLGLALAADRKLDEAIASYRRALEAKPDHAAAHTNLGNALLEQGKVAEAMSHYREAVRLAPDLALAHYNLGRVLRSQQALDEAMRHLRWAVELEPALREKLAGEGIDVDGPGKATAPK